MGEVMGLMNEGEKHKLITQLVDKVWESCTVKDDETHGAALWRVTALLILTPGSRDFNRRKFSSFFFY